MRDYSKLSLEERKAINEETKRLLKERVQGDIRKIGSMGKKVGSALYKVTSPLFNRFGKKLPKKKILNEK